MRQTFTAIGNACTDLMAAVDDNFLIENDIPKSFCKFITHAEDLEIIKSKMGKYETIAGGAGANVAHVISALGDPSHFISKIANDTVGINFKSQMEQMGVACHFPPPSPAEIGSPQVPTLITPDKERTFVSFDGVARNFSFADYDEELLKRTDYLYLDGYCYASSFTGESYIKAAKTVRAHGGHVTFNIGDKSYYNSHKKWIDDLLAICDSIMCSRAEAETFFGKFENQKDLTKTMSEKFLFGAVTDGENGATIFYNKEIIHVPAIRMDISKLVDTNGAGDHFSAGFIFGFMNGYTLEQSGKLGVLCATDCISHAGARPLGGRGSLKHLAELAKSC